MRRRLTVVALGLVVFQVLAALAHADIRKGSDPRRRPSGQRISISKGPDAGTGCVVAGDGTVRCWGVQTSVTLAPGPVSFSSPVTIAGVTSAIAVGVGVSHACALRADGKVLCWGGNLQLQLGRDLGRHPPRNLPTK